MSSQAPARNRSGPARPKSGGFGQQTADQARHGHHDLLVVELADEGDQVLFERPGHRQRQVGAVLEQLRMLAPEAERLPGEEQLDAAVGPGLVSRRASRRSGGS